MARTALTPERILDAIVELDREGTEVTVTTVRERLGSGSYSTIGAVLNDWRHRRLAAARSQVPEPPAQLRDLVSQLWSAAWRAAEGAGEAERRAFELERSTFQKIREEMQVEILDLEGRLGALTAERDHAAAENEVMAKRLVSCEQEATQARAQLSAAQLELDRIRLEQQRGVETLTNWVERASRAEALLATGGPRPLADATVLAAR